MSNTRAFIAAGIGSVALLAAAALPASAAPGDTSTTFTLNAGTLTVAVEASASLTAGSSGQASVSGALGDVDVTDARGGTVGWTASAMSTQFARNGGGSTVSTSVSYNSGTVSKTGTVTPTSEGSKPMAVAPSPVVTATQVTGNNTATWDPTLTVNLPSDSLAGDYSGTVTTSVA